MKMQIAEDHPVCLRRFIPEWQNEGFAFPRTLHLFLFETLNPLQYRTAFPKELRRILSSPSLLSSSPLSSSHHLARHTKPKASIALPFLSPSTKTSISVHNLHRSYHSPARCIHLGSENTSKKPHRKPN